MEENKSLNVEPQHLEEQNPMRNNLPPDSLQDYEKPNPYNDTRFNILSKFNLKSNEELMTEPKPPVQPLKMTSNNLKFQ
jgi:hypothetical protein